MDFFSISNNGGFGENVLIFRVDNSSIAHVDNRKKIIFGEGRTDVLDDPTLTAVAEYSINFSKQQGKFNLNYNGSNSL